MPEVTKVGKRGTVVIPAMLIILGFQLLLAAVQEDIRNVPSQPIWRRLVERDVAAAPVGEFAARGERAPAETVQ